NAKALAPPTPAGFGSEVTHDLRADSSAFWLPEVNGTLRPAYRMDAREKSSPSGPSEPARLRSTRLALLGRARPGDRAPAHVPSLSRVPHVRDVLRLVSHLVRRR